VTPISHDAPFGDQDARFWDWVLWVVIGMIVVGVLVAVLVATA